MMTDRFKRQTRSLPSELKTRSEDDEKMVIEGYFALYDNETELWRGAFEEISPGAFDKSLSNDIRALIDHETRSVLGRTEAGTLELKADTRGLWGSIKVNPNDTDAVNLYHRVKRGDVNNCSFGFNIPPGGEETDYRDGGTVKWTLREIDLHEVSVVTFPAYSDTGVQARKQEVKQHEKRQLELRKNKLKERLKNGSKATNASKKD